MSLYAVFGNPVAHSLSPWIHQRFAELTGLPGLVYEKRTAPTDGQEHNKGHGFAHSLAQFRAEGGQGCNVTVPFKRTAFALAEHPSPAAQLAQACNTLWWSGRGLEGDNTDGLGLVRDITQNAQRPLHGASVLLLGAGGAAAGVLGPLLAQHPKTIGVANRTFTRAQDLVARHREVAKQNDCPLEAIDLPNLAKAEIFFDVFINATASSLQGQALNLPNGLLGKDSLVYDTMYGPASAGFLQWAQACGAQTRDGLGMLVEQAAASFAIWHGLQAPAAQVLAELRGKLQKQ